MLSICDFAHLNSCIV